MLLLSFPDNEPFGHNNGISHEHSLQQMCSYYSTNIGLSITQENKRENSLKFSLNLVCFAGSSRNNIMSRNHEIIRHIFQLFGQSIPVWWRNLLHLLLEVTTYISFLIRSVYQQISDRITKILNLNKNSFSIRSTASNIFCYSTLSSIQFFLQKFL